MKKQFLLTIDLDKAGTMEQIAATLRLVADELEKDAAVPLAKMPAGIGQTLYAEHGVIAEWKTIESPGIN